MKFKTTFRGYSKSEVDQYLAEQEQKYSNLLATQKQHIDELADENFALRRQNQKYAQNERSISQALVDANNMATEMQGNAQKFAEITLSRAKLFYVAWNAYAKTLVATLTDEEVKRFNDLKDKIERTINAYEGGNVAAYSTAIARQMELDDLKGAKPQPQPQQQTAATQASAPSVASRPSGRLVNPIEKVEKAAGQQIDLREILNPKESLADLCRDLGLNVDDNADK